MAAGGDPVLWQHLFWIFGHPEVYILILPSFGIISDVMPTFSRKPLFGYPMVAYAGIVIGFIGWGVWSHHMFTVGLGPIADSFFVASTMIIAIPTAVKIFNWIGTMWGGSIRFTTAMLFSIGLVAEFTVGGLSGIMHAAAPVDLQQHDSYFVVAHFHYVIAGGVLMGLFAGMYYWYPKVTGRFMSEKLGKWHFWTGIIGFNMTFFPMHITGMFGMPRRTWTYQEELGIEFMNQITTVGGFVFGFSALILAYNLWRSAKHGEPASDDPWGGHTLEWSMPSPPHHYNFNKVPTVRSKEPMWHPEERAAVLADTMAEIDEEPHMPNGSYWPIILAAAISATWISLHWGKWWTAPIGVAVTLVVILMWSLEDPFAHDEGH